MQPSKTISSVLPSSKHFLTFVHRLPRVSDVSQLLQGLSPHEQNGLRFIHQFWKKIIQLALGSVDLNDDSGFLFFVPSIWSLTTWVDVRENTGVESLIQEARIRFETLPQICLYSQVIWVNCSWIWLCSLNSFIELNIIWTRISEKDSLVSWLGHLCSIWRV